MTSVRVRWSACMTCARRLMLAATYTGLITAVNNAAVCIDESTRNERTLTGQWNYTVTKIDAGVIDDWWYAGCVSGKKQFPPDQRNSVLFVRLSLQFVIRLLYAWNAHATSRRPEILVATNERDESVKTEHRSAFVLAFSTSKLLNRRPLPLLFIRVIGTSVQVVECMYWNMSDICCRFIFA